MKLSRKTLALASAATVAGALAVTGITSAVAATHQSATPFIHVTLMTTNPANSAPRSIIVNRTISDGGSDRPISKNYDRLTFTKGTFRLWHSNAITVQGFNSKSCSFHVAGVGTFRLDQGTGAYKGVTAHGIYHFQANEVGTRTASGACSRHGVAAFQEVIKAQGPVSG